MIRLKKILVPTDFSEPSKNALLYGCEFASKFQAELKLLHIVMEPVMLYPETGMLPVASDKMLTDMRDAAMQQLDKLPGPDWAGKCNVTREVLMGHPFVEIIRYAREQDVDCIVLGTHGRSGLSHLLLGSVAERVVRKAPCPVLTVRHPEHEFVMP